MSTATLSSSMPSYIHILVNIYRRTTLQFLLIQSTHKDVKLKQFICSEGRQVSYYFCHGDKFVYQKGNPTIVNVPTARKEIRVTPTEEDRSAGNFPEGKFCHNMAPRSLYMLKGSPTFTHLFVKFTIRAVFNLLQGQWSRPLQDPFEHLVF